MFYFDEIYGKKILRSDLIKNAFFTTRESFIETHDAGMFDIAEENRQEIRTYLKGREMVSPKQIHGNYIEVAKIGQESYPDTDALILNNKKQAIFLNFADCTPLIFYDKKRKVGAIAHAGWKGTVKRIGPKTVQKMVEEFNCEPKNIDVVIGPCISKCHFKVEADVQQKLYDSINRNPPKSASLSGEIYVDLKEINKIQLEN